MTRKLTSHLLGSLNSELNITVLDADDESGVGHHYEILGCRDRFKGQSKPPVHVEIKFQRGPVGEAGVNGISNEALLAIVEDRLTGFQANNLACRENEFALGHLKEAIRWLHQRTLARIERGVEGTSEI